MLIRATDTASIWSTGYATSDSEVLVGEELDRLLTNDIDLAALGGTFAAMHASGGQLRLVSDRHGAIPLYYAQGGAGWLASDDYWELADGLDSLTFDVVAAAEMLAFKYALEDRTLHSQIKEIPPASIVHLSESGAACFRYWYHDISPEKRRSGHLLSELDAVLDTVEGRSSSVGERLGLHRWGVNLTAGRDSRLIAQAAFDHGQLAACFTTRSPIEDAAAQVARTLGSPHIVLDPWVESHRTTGQIIADAISPTAMFHVAGHPLALDLAGPWPVDGFVSGHLGDMYAGSHLSVRTVNAASDGPAALEDYFVAHHSAIPRELLGRLLGRRHRELAGQPYERMGALLGEAVASDPLSAVLQVDLEQRQRRLILRDYVALRTLGPTMLWFADHAWTDFWKTVPFEWQLGTTLFERCFVERMGRADPRLAEIPINGRMARRIRFPTLRVRADDIVRRAQKKLNPRFVERHTPAPAPPLELADRTIERVEWLCDADELRRGSLPASVVYVLESIAHVAERVPRHLG